MFSQTLVCFQVSVPLNFFHVFFLSFIPVFLFLLAAVLIQFKFNELGTYETFITNTSTVYFLVIQV